MKQKEKSIENAFSAIHSMKKKNSPLTQIWHTVRDLLLEQKVYCPFLAFYQVVNLSPRLLKSLEN